MWRTHILRSRSITNFDSAKMPYGCVNPSEMCGKIEMKRQMHSDIVAQQFPSHSKQRANGNSSLCYDSKYIINTKFNYISTRPETRLDKQDQCLNYIVVISQPINRYARREQKAAANERKFFEMFLMENGSGLKVRRV